MTLLLSHRYISQDSLAALKSYVYHGEDRSYMYIYLLTPMNKFLVQYIPTWIAPNLITVTGLACTVTSHLLTLAYSPSFDSTLPPWLCFFAAFILFVYQTLDNLDGRQARRTASSSPLGLLFDHGVDAINVTISTEVMMAVLELGPTFKLFYLWATVFIPFVFATWEEYYTNSLVLAEINGPTDGVFLCVLFCVIAGIKPGFWSQSFEHHWPLLADMPIGPYQTHWFVIVAGMFAVLTTIAGNCREVAKHHTLYREPLQTLLSFLTLFTLSLGWIRSSPFNIFCRHPRIFLLAIGFLFCNMVCKLMLAHLCNMRYKPVRLVLIPFVATVASILALHSATGFRSYTLEFYALTGLLLFHFACWLHFVLNVIREITAALNIRVFSISQTKHTEH